jgi:hypothetical protein
VSFAPVPLTVCSVTPSVLLAWATRMLLVPRVAAADRTKGSPVAELSTPKAKVLEPVMAAV